MTYFLNTGAYRFYISSTHKGVDYVFGIYKLRPDNLLYIELGNRVWKVWV